jgi:cardiolipin synthase
MIGKQAEAAPRRRVSKRMIALITTVFYLAGFIAAGHAVLTTRTAPGAIAWSVSLVSMPFVAVPAYLVFGRSKFQGGVAAYEAGQEEIDERVREIRSGLEAWTYPGPERPGVYEALKALSGFGMVRGNRTELLVNGEPTFESILAGIARAEEYVLLQFYMIHDDETGRRVKDALIERARAGVRVYVLYDEIGSSGLPRQYVADLEDAGAEVSSFKPTQGAGNRFQLNFRNHRKIVVVDGVSAWVGGHNVGDEYLGMDPDFSPWRDTHVRIDGPAALQLQAVVFGDWYWATRELLDLTWEATPADGGDIPIMIVPSAPSQRLETAGLLFTTALHSARERIWISAPYFVPDEAVMKALELAALRGVDVRIITTGKPDSLPVYLAAFHYMSQLRDLGIRFYAYTPGFLHEKVTLIDEEWSTVGTANFDNRSFRLNFEVTAIIADTAFASEMEAMFEADFAHSVEIDPTAIDEKPLYWRLGVALSRLASPVL